METVGEPFILMDKTRFAVGERVFYWVGVHPTREDGVIPEVLHDTCHLTITYPDGTMNTGSWPWPRDGATHGGWRGGSGLDEPAAMSGKYTVVFEFAGRQSAPANFTVEGTPFLEKIKARFVFDTSVPDDTSVTLTVRNDTDQVLRFPHRGSHNGDVWITYDGIDGPGYVVTVYPEEKLLDADMPAISSRGFHSYTWENFDRMATIMVEPGQTYRHRLSLKEAVSWERTVGPVALRYVPSGRCKVTFSTILDVLIGEPEGEFAGLSPVRISVSDTGTCWIPAP